MKVAKFKVVSAAALAWLASSLVTSGAIWGAHRDKVSPDVASKATNTLDVQ